MGAAQAGSTLSREIKTLESKGRKGIKITPILSALKRRNVTDPNDG